MPGCAVLGASILAQQEPVCSEFRVGSPKWERCVEKAATGGATTPGATEPGAVCSEFPVGSAKWQECLEDVATGGITVPGGVDQDAVCTEFPVGSREWTDCVHDAATGGGLMPWIVVIPLGVMVIGMFVMFGRQWLGRGKPRDPVGTGGNWLLFMVLIEGSIAAGMTYAVIRGGGSGYLYAAIALWAVTLVMLVAGLAMRRRAARRGRILSSGIDGTATITGMTQTGMFINNNPVVEFQANIETPTGSYPATFRQMVPLISVGQLQVGARLAVKVDPNDPQGIVLAQGAPSTVPPEATSV